MKSSNSDEINENRWVSFELYYNNSLDSFMPNSSNDEIKLKNENFFSCSESEIKNNNDKIFKSFEEISENNSFYIFKKTLPSNLENNPDYKFNLYPENNKEEKNEGIKEKKIVKFIATKLLKKKRGRLRKSNTKKVKVHSKDAKDNIRKKIIGHFISFLIALANDAIKVESPGNEYNNFFKPILSKVKCKIKKDDILKLKYHSILTDYLISSNKGIKKKNKKYVQEEKTNKTNYENIIKKFPSLKKFFEQKIIDVFKNYYCKNKKDVNNMFDFNGVKIKLSSETKTFWDLLEKKENKNSKEKFINVINKNFGCNLLIDKILSKNKKCNNFMY